MQKLSSQENSVVEHVLPARNRWKSYFLLQIFRNPPQENLRHACSSSPSEQSFSPSHLNSFCIQLPSLHWNSSELQDAGAVIYIGYPDVIWDSNLIEWRYYNLSLFSFRKLLFIPTNLSECTVYSFLVKSIFVIDYMFLH